MDFDWNGLTWESVEWVNVAGSPNLIKEPEFKIGLCVDTLHYFWIFLKIFLIHVRRVLTVVYFVFTNPSSSVTNPFLTVVWTSRHLRVLLFHLVFMYSNINPGLISSAFPSGYFGSYGSIGRPQGRYQLVFQTHLMTSCYSFTCWGWNSWSRSWYPEFHSITRLDAL